MTDKMNPLTSPDAERGLLSCMLQDAGVADSVAERVSMEWFFSEGRQTLFAILVAQLREGKPFDLISLTNRLRNEGVLEQVGGAHELADLYSFAPGARQWEAYLQTVNECRVRRRLVQAGQQLVRLGQDAKGSLEAQLAEGEALLQEITDDANDSNPNRKTADI